MPGQIKYVRTLVVVFYLFLPPLKGFEQHIPWFVLPWCWLRLRRGVVCSTCRCQRPGAGAPPPCSRGLALTPHAQQTPLPITAPSPAAGARAPAQDHLGATQLPEQPEGLKNATGSGPVTQDHLYII
jgi:hypothetical protein